MDEMNQYPIPTRPQGEQGLAIASMVLGIVSIVFACCLWPISFIAAVVGLVLGIVSVKQNRDGKGMAIAGIIMCAIAIVLAICAGLFSGIFFAAIPELEDIYWYSNY